MRCMHCISLLTVSCLVPPQLEKRYIYHGLWPKGLRPRAIQLFCNGKEPPLSSGSEAELASCCQRKANMLLCRNDLAVPLLPYTKRVDEKTKRKQFNDLCDLAIKVTRRTLSAMQHYAELRFLFLAKAFTALALTDSGPKAALTFIEIGLVFSDWPFSCCFYQHKGNVSVTAPQKKRAGSRTISSLLIKMGFSGGLALAVAWSLKLFISESCNISCNMMAPSGASGSGSAEGTGGRGFGWTDLFGSSSTGNSETSLNQPDPTSPNLGEPAAPIAEVYHPLLEGRQRRQELNNRLGINSLGRFLSDEVRESTQFLMELKIEKALRSDRFFEDSLMYKRHQIRGILFYPNGKALSLQTYTKHMNIMENHGTHHSLPYQRLMEALYNKELELDGI
ncbi:hypothetical protein KPL71_012058 [Citrus sinensis]|uniref:Uncharacterized protein n=1 Tax=Citrus sinensis TaxID=2711 RepID=A0ACB8L823_CITSI|nr:hypothetical protein KPL71_012058 [Citrus sinensis]